MARFQYFPEFFSGEIFNPLESLQNDLDTNQGQLGSKARQVSYISTIIEWHVSYFTSQLPGDLYNLMFLTHLRSSHWLLME